MLPKIFNKLFHNPQDQLDLFVNNKTNNNSHINFYMISLLFLLVLIMIFSKISTHIYYTYLP